MIRKHKIGAFLLGLLLTAVAYAGLETVTHIQDLNASWPLGSDLASTSDDHIRNIKSALKTDFPNFNGTYTSAALPVFAIPSDTNTGMYSVGADDLGFTAGGTLRFDISTTALTSTLPMRAPDGTQAAPAISFANDTDNGAYRVGANDWALVAGNTQVARLSTSGAFLQIQDGTTSAPSMEFLSDPNTGIYHAGADIAGLVAGGIDIVEWRSVGVQGVVIQSGSTLYNQDGTAGTPSYNFANDQDTGFYRDTNNQIGIALGGSTAGQIAQGTYTGTLTGVTGTVTGTVSLQRVGNMVIVSLPTTLQGTSNASTATITGSMPSIFIPASNVECGLGTLSNGGSVIGSVHARVNTSTGTIELGFAGSYSSWTGSGTKGVTTRETCVYYN